MIGKTPEEYKELFEKLTSSSLEKQRDAFILRFIYQLDKNEVKNVFQVYKNFADFVNKHKQGGNSIPISSGLFTKFLGTQGIAWTQRERKRKLDDFDLDKNGEICLLEFLMLHYKSMVLTQYFLRQGYGRDEITPQITEASGIISDNYLNTTIDIREALMSEMFQHPFGVDKVLDGGLIEFNKIMQPRNEEMKQLENIINDSSTSKVDKMKAENELKKMHDEFDEPLRNTEIRFQTAIKKLRQQQDKYYKEIMSSIEKELDQSRKVGKLSDMRKTFLQATSDLNLTKD